MDEVVVERVLRAVELVPPGRVVSYGDIAGLVGIGPRQVGWVMRHYGGNVAWWRVVNASGDHADFHRRRAFEIWADEGIEVKPNGLGCRIRDYRADLELLAEEHARVCADLPPR